MRRREAVALLCAMTAAACSPALASVVSASSTAPPSPVVLAGVDVLLRDGLDRLSGQRLGLVTNATGRTRDGHSSIDALFGAWTLTALFSPEHGIRGDAEAGQSVDS